MSIDERHALYEIFAPKWQRIRDAVEGADAVRAAGETHLPKLTGQDETEYSAYALRANFFNATARTHQAYHGMIFAKPPMLDIPEGEQFATLFDDVDMQGNTLAEFASNVVSEVLQTNRIFVIVDHTGSAENPDGRPYLRSYPAEAVFNWAERVVNGVRELAAVRIAVEYDDPNEADEFSRLTGEEIRVYDIDPATGFYRVRVFRRSDQNAAAPARQKAPAWTLVGEPVTPTIGGQPLAYIPAAFIGSTDHAAPSKPPLLDLADVNLSHFRTSADLEHGAHFTGLPQPWVAGVNLDPGETLTIGSASAWTFDSPDAKAGYLEFTGQGLGALERLLDRKEKQMAAVGARMLAPEKAQAESGEALAIKRGGDFAVLSAVAAGVSRKINALLYTMLEWASLDGDVAFTLNNKFVDEALSPDEIRALLLAYQGGGMSLDTLLWNLQRGGRIPEEVTVDDEKEKIKDGADAGALNPDGTDPADDEPLVTEPADDADKQ